MSKRVHFYACIATPFDSAATEAAMIRLLGEALCRRFAGCSINTTTGFWSPDGDQDKTEYAKPVVERTFEIHLSVLPELQAEAKEAILEAARKLKTLVASINYVHIESFETQAHHTPIGSAPPEQSQERIVQAVS